MQTYCTAFTEGTRFRLIKSSDATVLILDT